MIHFLPLPSQLSIMETPLQMGIANSTGLSLPQFPVGGLQYLPRKGRISVYLILLQLTVAHTKSR